MTSDGPPTQRRTLYVQTPGSQVRRLGGALEINVSGESRARLPVHRLRRVMLWPGTHITTPALRLLMRAGVDAAFFDGRGLAGSVRSPASGSVARLLAQVGAHRCAERSTQLARELVVGKCTAQAHLLARLNDRSQRLQVRSQLATIRSLCVEAESATALDVLRGLEGASARAYFDAYGVLFKGDWRFSGRNRRPPRDPVNALLSLGYVLLINELRADTEARGLDPRLGFLHQVRAGRPALALDLVEPWRAPGIDRLVLTTLNRGVLRPDDFESRADIGVRLSNRGFDRFIAAYERHLGSREQGDGLRRRIAAWLDGFEDRLMEVAE